MGQPDVTVVIPVHPQRLGPMHNRALNSVYEQTVAAEIIGEVDWHRRGGAATRTAALGAVTTEWVAFLDSDDEMDSEHLALLLACQRRTGGDVVYPWFRVVGGPDPWPRWRKRPFDEAALRRREFVIPVTVLARTALIRAAGGFIPDLTIAPPAECDEWTLWLRMLDAGARFVHLPEVTWTWHLHDGNTSGSPHRGDARAALRGPLPG